jgi:hypothetical protein
VSEGREVSEGHEVSEHLFKFVTQESCNWWALECAVSLGLFVEVKLHYFFISCARWKLGTASSPSCGILSADCMGGEQGFAVRTVLSLMFCVSRYVNRSEGRVAGTWRQRDRSERTGLLVQGHSFVRNKTLSFAPVGPESNRNRLWWQMEVTSSTTTKNGTWLSGSSSPHQLWAVLRLHYLWLV